MRSLYLGPLEPELRRDIGNLNHVAARERQRTDTTALRPALVAQHDRRLIEIVRIGDADHPELTRNRVEDVVRAGQRTRVRGRGAAAVLGASELQHDDRLLELRGAFGQRYELVAILHAFERHHHDLRGRRLEHERRKVRCFQVGFVPAAHDVVDPDTGLQCAPHHVDGAEAAALTDDADVAFARQFGRDHAAGRHREAIDEVDHSVAVRAHHAHTAFACKRRECRLALASFRGSGLAEAGGEYGRERNAPRVTFTQHGQHLHGGNDEPDVIRRFRQIAHARVTRHAPDLAPSRVDRQDTTRIAELQHLPQETPAEAGRVVGRADNRDAARREESGEIGWKSGQFNACESVGTEAGVFIRASRPKLSPLFPISPSRS